MFSICYIFVILLVPSFVASDQKYSKELATLKLFHYSVVGAIDVSEVFPLPRYDPSKSLKVLIHGWNTNFEQPSMVPVRDALVAQNQHNVLMADWKVIASKIYPTARQLVRPLGYRFGSILEDFMKKVNLTYDDVHVIGHSLGAHIAGNVGKYFDGKLARITALDPAGPLFTLPSNDAYNKGDARFVDSIHTDIVLGEIQHRAHVDFYPNRGGVSQPGCEVLDKATIHLCSHLRALIFYAESILEPHNFIAHRCPLEDIRYRPESCLPAESGKPDTSVSVFMGEYVDQSVRGTFYLRTSDRPPFGLGQAVRREHENEDDAAAAERCN